MSKDFTVLIQSVDGSLHNGIDIRTADNSWTCGGPGNIFNTKKGTYSLIGGDEGKLLVLKSSALVRVGDLRGFDPESTKEGQKGVGISDETGTAYNWTADKCIDV